jgi:hypothetical protein
LIPLIFYQNFKNAFFSYKIFLISLKISLGKSLTVSKKGKVLILGIGFEKLGFNYV